MELLLKTAKYALIVLVVLLLLLVVGGGSWRAYVQHSSGEQLVIDAENGVDEGGYVEIGDTRQWLQMRGQDHEQPIVLLLNGGPGASWLRATQVLQPWEEEFVFVQWDQRGAGRSYAETGAEIGVTMSIERMVRDGIEVVEHVTEYLGQDKVILLGHSWGSLLGMEMVRRRPELFHAYVGTAQIGDLEEDLNDLFTDVEDAALSQGDNQAQTHLINLGRPPYEDYQEYLQLFQLRAEMFPEYEPEAAPLPYGGLAAPDYSLKDYYHLFQGMRLSMDMLYPAMVNHDIRDGGLDIEVPVFMFHGEEDQQMPLSSARELLDDINAPHSEFVTFPEEGHFVFLETETFLPEFIRRVRPHAID